MLHTAVIVFGDCRNEEKMHNYNHWLELGRPIRLATGSGHSDANAGVVASSARLCSSWGGLVNKFSVGLGITGFGSSNAIASVGVSNGEKTRVPFLSLSGGIRQLSGHRGDRS